MKHNKNIKIFLSYAWGYRDKDILSFVSMLRKKGFEAVNDKILFDGEASKDIVSMMHNEILKSDKIIVVLSETYKQKAENDNKSGVGQEYRLIKSVLDDPKKVILTTFEKTSKDLYNKILPLWFKDRSVINLPQDQKNNFNELFSKLLDEPIIEIPKVSNTKPKIKKTIPRKFNL